MNKIILQKHKNRPKDDLKKKCKETFFNLFEDLIEFQFEKKSFQGKVDFVFRQNPFKTISVFNILNIPT